MKKRAQMKMSFGMIFSIILIIIFLAVAFYGIKMFLGMQTKMQIKQFENDLQVNVNKMQRSDSGSVEQEYILPKKIKQVCFEDKGDGDENLFFVCDDFIESGKINHLNLEGRKCIKNINGKINITLKKNYGKNWVMIE